MIRILSDEHASEVQLCWLYRQQTETIRRHAHVLLLAGEGAKQTASEYLAELARRESEDERAAA